MNQQRAAEIQIVLEGVHLPASRAELIAYAEQHDARAAAALRSIADRSYTRIDEVGEELASVQPHPPAVVPVPRAESGQPPGGEDYTKPHPESGEIRVNAPPDNPTWKQIDRNAAVVAKQKQVQQEGPG